MGWLLKLVPAEIIVWVFLAVTVSLSALSGYLYVSKANVQVKLAEVTINYDRCKVNTITLESAIETNNRKIEEEAKKRKEELIAAKQKLDAVTAKSAKDLEALNRKYASQTPALPDDLCASTQLENKIFIKEQQK